MLIRLVTATRVAGLTYKLVSSTVLTGLLIYEVVCYVRRVKKTRSG